MPDRQSEPDPLYVSSLIDEETFAQMMMQAFDQPYVASDGVRLYLNPLGAEAVPTSWHVEASAPPHGTARIRFHKGIPGQVPGEVRFDDAYVLPGEEGPAAPVGGVLVELRSAIGLLVQSGTKATRIGDWVVTRVGNITSWSIPALDDLSPDEIADLDPSGLPLPPEELWQFLAAAGSPEDHSDAQSRLPGTRVIVQNQEQIIGMLLPLVQELEQRRTETRQVGMRSPTDTSDSEPPDGPRPQAVSRRTTAQEGQFPPGFPELPSTRKRHKETYRVCRDLRKEYHRLWEEGETSRREPEVREYQDALEAKGMRPYKERRLRDILRWGDEGLFDKLS